VAPQITAELNEHPQTGKSGSAADALAQEERGPVKRLAGLAALRSDLERRHLGLPAG
jgi:hypothetical protein